ncbi:MAG TPA: SpoIVB peptidase S55 domain-containing protein [Acidobacteriaceae bacterium]|nr:SpoIVB peptidase S55 domain-containing protein [Acidobacteriaceae bacterium]
MGAALLLAMTAAASGWAQSSADVQTGALHLPPDPPTVTKFFPLSGIHRGEQGVAYTVFEGTKPEPMGVEILGVLHNAIGPRQDMILARLEGAKPEYTGVVEGMSGSPVYIDGKLVGALAFRIGQFSKEPICGITPIQQMLGVEQEVQDQGTELTAQSTGLSGQPAAAGGYPAAVGFLRASDVSAPGAASIGSSLIQPMDTPLVFSGFSAGALALWKEYAPAGLMPVEGIGGSESDEKQPDPLIPGSAVSAVLVRGDLDIAATCTVTYVDPKRMLACGHPITQFGPVSMPMTKADVVATLPSPAEAFKIINTTETVGSITEDRESAILGEFGKPARMIPVTLHVTGEPGETAATGGAENTLHFEVIDQPQVTPMAVMVAVYQGLMQQNGYSAQTTYRVQGAVKLSGYPEVKLNRLVAPTDTVPANLAAALALGERFMKLYDNAARRTPIESVDLEVAAIPRRLTAEIESAQVSKVEIHPGDTVTLNATIRPWHGDPRNVQIPVTLPANLPEGPVRLLVSDGTTLDRLLQPPQFNAQPLDISATIAQLNSTHPSDRLYVTLLAPEAQAAVEGHTLTAIPLSMANVLAPLKDNNGMALNGESAMPMASLPMDAVISGMQVVTLQVEDQ